MNKFIIKNSGTNAFFIFDILNIFLIKKQQIKIIEDFMTKKLPYRNKFDLKNQNKIS
jgi:hypothetical protein